MDMNEEEKRAIGWLSALDVKSEFEATNKEIILSLIEKQDKMIDKEKLTDREKEFLWEITRKGIDLDKLLEKMQQLGNTLKPVLELYAKNMITYLKLKEKKDE